LVALGARTLQDCPSLSPYDGPRIVCNISRTTSLERCSQAI